MDADNKDKAQGAGLSPAELAAGKKTLAGGAAGDSAAAPAPVFAPKSDLFAEWAAGGAVAGVAGFVVAHFYHTQWREFQPAPLYSVYRSLFEVFDVHGVGVEGGRLLGGGLFATGLVVGFLTLARLLLDRSAALWLRAALFGVCFASGLVAWPILAGMGLVRGGEIGEWRMVTAVVCVSAALALAVATAFLWEKVLPAWAIYALAFGLGLAALGAIDPLSWDPVLFTSLGWLIVVWIAGHLLMSCWETYLPPRAGAAVAFVVGLSVCGVLTELLAMAHLFHRWWIAGSAAALLLGLAIAAKLRQSRPLEGEGDGGGANGFSSDPSDRSDGSDGSDQPNASAPRDDRGASPERIRLLLRDLARERYEATILRADRGLDLWVWRLALAGIYLITALTFYHGCGYFETYWDSLILYLGYARMTFLEGGFPFKAVAQVGIGLGANYPHLYPTLAATGPALAGQWSILGGQIAAPLAGALSCLLVYHLVLRLTRREIVAILAALLFRAVPLGVIYSIYASDYAFAVLFAVAFMYLAAMYIETAVPGYLAAMTLVCAGAAHINYLMLALWGLWALAMVLAHARRELRWSDVQQMRAEQEAAGWVSRGAVLAGAQEGEVIVDDLLPYAENHPRMGLRGLLRTKGFWSLTTAGLLLASTWYVRNEVLTGNPVYSFFPDLFGGVRINPRVLESATQEWRTNGVGMARIADQRLGIAFEDLTVWDKIRHAPWFFYAYKPAWQWEPVLFAWVLPGLVLALGGMARRALKKGESRRLALRIGDFDRIAVLAFVMLFGFLAYHVALADFYIYQIIPAMAAWPVFFVPVLESARRAPWRVAMIALIFAAVVCPGLPVALMGGKINRPDLVALRRIGMTPDEALRLRFGADVDMIAEVNQVCKGRPLLTHENRHLLFDPSITLVHLDDWETQQLWGRPPDEVVKGLKELGIGHYLRVPNEFSHPINERLGMQRLIDEGRLRLIGRWASGPNGPANELYALR